MAILLRSTGSVAGATILASILVVMQYFANVGLLASASRMCWSFARDRGLPGWRMLQHVSVPLLICSGDLRTNADVSQSGSRSMHALLFPSGPSSSPRLFRCYSHSSSSDRQRPSTISSRSRCLVCSPHTSSRSVFCYIDAPPERYLLPVRPSHLPR